MKARLPSLSDALELFKSQALTDSFTEIPASEARRILSLRGRKQDDGEAAWDFVSSQLRRPRAYGGCIFHWNFIRDTLEINRIPTTDQIEQFAAYYREGTPRDLESAIRKLNGRQFEILMVALMERVSKFRGVIITKMSHDGGIDFRGLYVPEEGGLEIPLVGQAKHQNSPVSSGQAREFVGALDSCDAKSPIGLFASTAGFAPEASATFERSTYHVIKWGMAEIRDHLLECGLGVKTYSPTIQVLDDVFWGELCGRPE